MATKPKKVVTYNDPVDDNADYLVPLQDDSHAVAPPRPKSSTKKSAPPVGLFGSINFLITMLLYAGVPISQFVIGLIYINRCTIQQFISTYMILSGIFGIAFFIVGIIIYKKVNEQAVSSSSSLSSYGISLGKPKSLKILIPIFVLLFLSVITWFAIGQAVVFQVKLRVEFFDSTLPEYCHGNLYKAAYILIFVDYLLFLICGILCALGRSSPPTAEKKKTTTTKRPPRPPRK